MTQKLSTDHLSRCLGNRCAYIRPMKNLTDYLRDTLHERRIHSAVKACKDAQAKNDTTSVLALWDDMCRLINQRSPVAIKRMERRRGLV